MIHINENIEVVIGYYLFTCILHFTYRIKLLVYTPSYIILYCDWKLVNLIQ